jgi:hypothetical protein
MIKKFLILTLIIMLSSCGGILKPKKVDTRNVPIKAGDRARKNVNEGKGSALGDLIGGGRGSTNYEFSTSNPMWRASLEILDFLPLTTVDYSGGMLITDWYTENNSDESIKITVRFLANEVRSDSIKVIVHKKKCLSSSNCTTNLLNNSAISRQLRTSIIKKAAELEVLSKNKKK